MSDSPQPLSSVAATPPRSAAFTGYERFVIGVLAVLQFTVILDFGILAPLGPLLMPALRIVPGQFGTLVSAYAFSACLSGLLAAGFADRFDRKKMLVIFYTGFLAGTLCCGLAPSYPLLLGARVVTGIFGGVISSIAGAIVADLFPMEVRGRVMGMLQAAFSASMVMGLPVGLFLGNHIGWHGPFLVLAGLGLVVGVILVIGLRPITGHIGQGEAARRSPMGHLLSVATTPRYLVGFAATMLVATGGYMLQPFASVFSVHNLGVKQELLPLVYMGSGMAGLVLGPILGRISDTIGKFRMFAITSLLSIVYLVWYTHLGPSPLWLVIAANCFFSAILSGRIASTMALASGVPAPGDRGAYMAIGASMQQLSGGVASWVAGLVVVITPAGTIANYAVLGWIVIGATLVTLAQMYRVAKMVQAR